MPKRRRQDSDTSSHPTRRARRNASDATSDITGTNTASTNTPPNTTTPDDITATNTSAFQSRFYRLQHEIQQQELIERPDLSIPNPQDALYAQTLANQYLQEDLLRAAIDRQIRVLLTNIRDYRGPGPRTQSYGMPINGRSDIRRVPYHQTKRGMNDERYIKMMCEGWDLEGYSEPRPVGRPRGFGVALPVGERRVPGENPEESAGVEEDPVTEESESEDNDKEKNGSGTEREERSEGQ